MTQRDDMGRVVGGGFRFGNSCTPVVDSCQCMAKPIQYCKFKKSLKKTKLEKAMEPEIKLPTSAGSSKKQERSRKTSISALLTMPKPLTVWITVNCGKFLKEVGIPDYLTCLLRNLYAGQEANS